MKKLVKSSSTLFLKLVIILLGIAVLALCIFALPAGIMSDRVGYYRPLLIGMYLPALPFFFALYQGFKLLQLVDANKAFSQESRKALGYLKYSVFIIGILYAIGLPYIYFVAERDDAPGVMLLGLIFTFAPLVIGLFAGILQNLLGRVIDMKSENDLIV